MKSLEKNVNARHQRNPSVQSIPVDEEVWRYVLNLNRQPLFCTSGGMVSVFKPGSLARVQIRGKTEERRAEEVGQGCGHLPGGLWAVMLVYCLSALIFIKLWGQMQSDAVALLWKGGWSNAVGERQTCLCEISTAQP